MSVLQNRPARSVLAAAMLTALIASMLMLMPSAEAQSPSTTVTATPSSDATITVQWTSVSGRDPVRRAVHPRKRHRSRPQRRHCTRRFFRLREPQPAAQHRVQRPGLRRQQQRRTRPHRRDDVRQARAQAACREPAASTSAKTNSRSSGCRPQEPPPTRLSTAGTTGSSTALTNTT